MRRGVRPPGTSTPLAVYGGEEVTMRKTLLIMVTALTMVPGLALAGGGGHASGCSGFTEGTEMGMADSCYEGVTHFVPAGQTLTVRNDGEMPHSITAVDGSFDSGLMQPGETYAITLTEPGVVRVYCTLHGTADGGGMAGVLISDGDGIAAVGQPRLDGGADTSAGTTGSPIGGTVLAGAALVVALTAFGLSWRRRPGTLEA